MTSDWNNKQVESLNTVDDAKSLYDNYIDNNAESACGNLNTDSGSEALCGNLNTGSGLEALCGNL